MTLHITKRANTKHANQSARLMHGKKHAIIHRANMLACFLHLQGSCAVSVFQRLLKPLKLDGCKPQLPDFIRFDAAWHGGGVKLFADFQLRRIAASMISSTCAGACRLQRMAGMRQTPKQTGGTENMAECCDHCWAMDYSMCAYDDCSCHDTDRDTD
jgi:hypothetical protein